MSPIRVLVVDDSPLVRQIVVDILRREPDIQVVGFARNGEEALERVAELKPDVVTLDLDMPRVDGLTCLRRLMSESPVRVVMVSTLTSAGAANTLEALVVGAIDFVCKPNNGSISTLRGVKDELVAKVRQARQARVPERFAAKKAVESGNSDAVVLVAGATGGPRALTTLFEGLPKNFACPMIIVQHLPAPFVPVLAQKLNAIGTVPVREAVEGDRLTPGLALIAPGGRHTVVDEEGYLRFEDSPPKHGARPAADRLLETAAVTFGARCVAAVLSGASQDGAAGTLAIFEAGGTVFAEDEETCTAFDMPKAALDAGSVYRSVPIDFMSQALVAASAGRIPHAA